MVYRHSTVFTESSLYGISDGYLSEWIVGDGPGVSQVMTFPRRESNTPENSFRSDVKLYKDTAEIKYSKTLDSCKIPQVNFSWKSYWEKNIQRFLRILDSTCYGRTSARASNRSPFFIDWFFKYIFIDLSFVYWCIYGDGHIDTCLQILTPFITRSF